MADDTARVGQASACPDDLSRTLIAAQPPLRSGWDNRAVASMVEAKPARRWFTRRAAIALAFGAAALVGLGFVPIPLGRTKGVLARAAAAMEQSPNLYTERRVRESGKDIVVRTWQTADWRQRIEEWEDGKLASLTIADPERQLLNYDAASQTLCVDDMPPAPPGALALRGSTEDIRFEKLLFERWQNGYRVEEWRERSLWGGEVDIAEITHGSSSKTRYEIDPVSGLPMARREYTREGSGWKLSDSSQIECNVDLPDDLWTFTPPPGTKETRRAFWAARTEKPISEGSTEDWEVKIYPLEVDPQGNLHTVLLTWPLTDRARLDLTSPWTDVSAVDDLGVRYTMQNGCGYTNSYWSLTLLRPTTLAPVGAARTATVTIHPTAHGETKDQQITFPDLPLPAPTADAGQAKTEVIQH